jgi:hypothetical protein
VYNRAEESIEQNKQALEKDEANRSVDDVRNCPRGSGGIVAGEEMKRIAEFVDEQREAASRDEPKAKIDLAKVSIAREYIPNVQILHDDHTREINERYVGFIAILEPHLTGKMEMLGRDMNDCRIPVFALASKPRRKSRA